jgi:hypothetical protein
MQDMEHTLRQVTGVSGRHDQTMTGANQAYAELIEGAILPPARKIEAMLKKIVTAGSASPQPGQTTGTPGACTIKQVRRANGKMLSAKVVADPPSPMQ